MDHVSRARRLHAELFLRRLQRIERQSPGPGTTVKDQREAFDRIWPQVHHAAEWVIARAGADADADKLCAEYPMAASAYWYFQVAPHERMEILQAALAAARRLGWAIGVASLNSALGIAYLDAGYPSKAVARFQEAEDLHKGTPDEAYNLGQLALAYLELDWPGRAVHHLNSALALCRRDNDHYGTALMLERLAHVYRELDQPERSDEFTGQAVAIVAEHDREHSWILDMHRRYFRSGSQLHHLYDRALGLLENGRPADAISELQDAVSLARSSGAISVELDMLSTWVRAALDLGDDQQALEYAAKQVQRSEIAPWDKQWEAICRLGDVYRATGRPERALEYHQQALRLLAGQAALDDDGGYDLPGMMVDDEDGLGAYITAVNARRRTLTAIAADHEALGEHAAAIAHYIKALKDLGIQEGGPVHAQLSGQLALAYATTGQYAHAMANRRTQLEIYQKIQDRAGEAVAIADMGNIRMVQDLYPQALDLYQAAAVVIMQIASDRNMLEISKNLAHAELHLGRPLRAAHYAAQALPVARGQGDPAAISYLERIIANAQRLAGADLVTAADAALLSEPVVLRGYDQTQMVCEAFTTEPVSDHVRAAARAGLRLGELAVNARNAGLARAAWRGAAASGDPVIAPVAAEKLAWLLEAAGANDDEAWGVVMDAGDSIVAAAAAQRMGRLHAKRGALSSARSAFEKAIVLGGDELRHVAADLGAVLEVAGDELGAREAFRQAVGCDDPDLRAAASYELGRILKQQGDLPGALQAFGQARTARRTRIAATAMHGIGQIHMRQGNLADASLALQDAIATGDPYAAPAAGNSLGMIRLQQGDRDAAKTAFELAITSPEPEVVVYAAGNLAILADMLGPDHAERLLASIAPTGDRDADSALAFRLAAARLKRGDYAGAAQAWLRTAGNDPQRASEAVISFAQWTAEQEGGLDEADEALAQVAILDDPQAQIYAISTRVRLLADHGRAEQAISVLTEAIEHGGPEVQPAAALFLAGLYADRDDDAAATAALELAAGSGHPSYASQAIYNLGVRQQKAGNLTRARELYEQVISSGTEMAPYAANNLCAVHMAMGDLEAAEAALRPALDSDNAEQAAKAWANLGVFRWRRGDRDGAQTSWHQAAAVDINVAPEIRRLREHLKT